MIDKNVEPAYCKTPSLKFKIRIMKIAITFSDGQHVDSYYGNADMTFIYDIKGNEIKSVEKQHTKQYYGKNHMNKTGAHLKRLGDGKRL